jgi:hypothetical protein
VAIKGNFETVLTMIDDNKAETDAMIAENKADTDAKIALIIIIIIIVP